MDAKNEFDQFLQLMTKNKIAYFQAINPDCEKDSIVLLGDSLVEYFPIYEMYKGKQPVYNRGIGGDTTYGVLRRLEETVFALRPSKVFLLIGSNDLLPTVPNNSENEIASRIIEIADRLVKNKAETKVYIQSLYPINSSNDPCVYSPWVADRSNRKIERLNSIVESYCATKHYEYIDVYSHLLDGSGQLDIHYCMDGIHVNYEGYKIVLSILEKYI